MGWNFEFIRREISPIIFTIIIILYTDGVEQCKSKKGDHEDLHLAMEEYPANAVKDDILY